MRSLIVGTGAALALLLTMTTALAQTDSRTINIPLSNPGEPVSLEIGMTSARIEVIGEERDDAAFDVSIEEGDRVIVTPSGVTPVTHSGYSLEVEEQDNKISVDSDRRANKVSIVARVPKRANLELSARNDSEIIVSNISGNLQLSNTNGPITARGISGSVIATSINDTVNISFDSIDDVTASSMESVNGELNLYLPENLGVQVHLDTTQGEIVSDFEVDVQPSEPNIEYKDNRRGMEVRIDSVIIANINGGGPIVRMKSLNGNIRILKAK